MNPSDTPATQTYEVTPGRLIHGQDPWQAATVGRTSTGINLHLTEDAAQALAQALIRLDAARGKQIASFELADFDASLWVHVAVDLIAARAIAVHSRRPADEAAPINHAIRIEQSGYIPPRSQVLDEIARAIETQETRRV